MKKILYIAPSISVKGGISTVIKNYLNTELPQQYRIILIGTNKDGSKLLKLFIAFFSLIHTTFLLMFNNIDIVHIHGSDPVSSKRKYFFFKIAKLFPCKIIYHFHGASFMENYPDLSLFWKERFRELFECSDLVICLSNSWKRNIHSFAPSANIVVVPNSISVPTYTNPPKEDDTVLKITFLGRVGERKGIFDLLIVLKKLLDNDMKAKLSIGGNGEIEKLLGEVKKLNIGNNVNYLGWVSPKTKDALLRNTDIFILPSYGEGMPMAILEAMSYSIPVISTPVGGIPELVIDNETGFLVEPGDIDNLYEKIVELGNDKEKRNRFGQCGRDTIENEHNINNEINIISKIYSGL